jgi:hypothetical protein
MFIVSALYSIAISVILFRPNGALNICMILHVYVSLVHSEVYFHILGPMDSVFIEFA